MFGTCAEEGLSRAGHQIGSGWSRQPSRQWDLPCCGPSERVGGVGALSSSSCRRPTKESYTLASSSLLSCHPGLPRDQCGRGQSKGDHWPRKLRQGRQNMGRCAQHSRGWWTSRLLVLRWQAMCMRPIGWLRWVGLYWEGGLPRRQPRAGHRGWSACQHCQLTTDPMVPPVNWPPQSTVSTHNRWFLWSSDAGIR